MSASDKRPTPPCPKTWERPGATLRCIHPGGEGHKGICTWPNPRKDPPMPEHVRAALADRARRAASKPAPWRRPVITAAWIGRTIASNRRRKA